MIIRTLRSQLRLPKPVYISPPCRYYSTDLEKLKKESDTTESDNSASATGVIDKTHNEVLLYYDHIYPFTTLPWSTAYDNEKLKQKVWDLSSPLATTAKITEFVPLRRDSGAFVKFKYPPEVPATQFIEEIRENVERNEQERVNSNILTKLYHQIWRNVPKVYSVKGTPWIEDLRRFPSPKLSVKFEGDPLTEEELYVLFRRYGLINEIEPGATEAFIYFHSTRAAISAKHCITGMVLNGGKTTLHIQFVAIKRSNFLVSLISNHTKIAIPVLIALLATFAVLIFDPIREWFIEYKILHNRKSFDQFKESRWFNQIQENESNMFWIERYEKSKQLQLWIMENANTFIIVKGPQGSGKEEFVLEHSLGSDERLSKKVLVLECDQLGKARSDNNLINTTASQLGYFPVFTWTNTVSRFVDLGVQGLTGQKSGLSESKETQIKNMFSLATQAIRKITTNEYNKYVKSVERRNKRLKDDEKIEVLKEEQFLQQHPEAKPIIVLNKYSRRADVSSNDFIPPLVADWASGLVQNNTAHVIFLTADVGSLQLLNDALPNQVFKDISLSDASMSSSRQMLDLQSFIRRIKSGESPQQAINEMISQAAELINTFFLNSHHKFGAGDSNWDPSQVWLIMKLLSECDTISYSELVKSPLFKVSKETLEILTTLEKYDLISLKRDKGVLDKISTGRPLFKAAFANIISDLRIWKLYETEYIGRLISLEAAKIQKLEEELEKIYKIGKVDGRIDYVSQKIEASNKKILDLEKQAADVASYTGKPDGKSFLGIKF
ncbi:RNA12 family protein [Candida albicans]|uniref:Mitochondrial escape protein 2 n=1 Tax=Candida albicans TaxID=5476 RepID=A0A8H6C5N4_CANAX|nr:RNA12 family protein [Candida albicans]